MTPIDRLREIISHHEEAEVRAEAHGIVDELARDAERYRWVARLFERKWNGVVGAGSSYRYELIGDWRHIVNRLDGETIDAAIDSALKGAK